MTPTDLARRVEVSIPYLSRIERERENPLPDHLLIAMPMLSTGRAIRRSQWQAAFRRISKRGQGGHHHLPRTCRWKNP